MWNYLNELREDPGKLIKSPEMRDLVLRQIKMGVVTVEDEKYLETKGASVTIYWSMSQHKIRLHNYCC